MDTFAELGAIDATAQALNIPTAAVRRVLEDPLLGKKLLARRRGVFISDFIDKVLPAQIEKASDPERTGSTTAARLIAEVLGLSARGAAKPDLPVEKLKSAETRLRDARARSTEKSD